MIKALTIGSATIDIIATVANDDIEQMTFHNSTASFLLMEPGRKVDATSVITQAGGGAVNAAISMARQGSQVNCLIKIGQDLNGDKIKHRLQEEGVGTEFIAHDSTHSTAVSVMITAHDRNAAIFTHRGANGYLTTANFSAALFEKNDLIYVTNLSNKSADHFPYLVEAAKKAQAFVAVNPGIRQLTSRAQPFFYSLTYVDMLTLNREEASAFLTTLKALQTQASPVKRNAISFQDGLNIDIPTLKVVGDQMALPEFFARLHMLGPRYIAMTDGAKGAYLSDGKAIIFVAAEKVSVKGTAGAGDAFSSTLATQLVAGKSLAHAARMATKNAAAVIQQVDAQSGLLMRDQFS